jgi:thiamine-phosphate pyrophosphorylase
LEKIAEAARCGVDYIQLREKDLPALELESLAVDALGVLRIAAKSPTKMSGQRTGTRLLVNSRTDVAIACGAAGVHLRADDILASEVRSIWNRGGRVSSPTVGVSCHSGEEVRRAAAEGADFVVFAPVFGKSDIAGANPAGLNALEQACREKIPVLALGGVALENASACMEAGAAGIAGIRLFQEDEIARLVEVLRGLTARRRSLGG